MEGQGRVKAYLEGKDEETIILALTKFFNKYFYVDLGVISMRRCCPA